MAKISVAICCANAENTLEATCQSVQWADECIIVDSGSEDNTPQIAQRYADTYVVEPWRGYTEQKQFSASLCKHDWVLILDSDEEVTPELAQTIQSLTQDELNCCDVFWMKRRNFVLGRHVRAWDPDWQSRLIHRHKAQWQSHALHEGRRASDPTREGRLQGDLLHKRTWASNADNFDDYFGGSRLDERLLPVARQMYDDGKRCRPWDLLLRPWFAFFKFYVLKRGFLDGSFGLLMAQKASVSTQLKYAALWHVQNLKDG